MAHDITKDVIGCKEFEVQKLNRSGEPAEFFGSITEDEHIVNKKYVDDELLKAWLLSVGQTGLTGDKTGTFNLTTTGEGGFGGLMPYDSATFDLGSVGLRWRNLILSGDITTLGNVTAATFNATNEDDVLQVDGSCILRTGTAANNNVFLGGGSFANDDGGFNVGLGFETGKNNDTTGGNGEPKGKQNVYIGYHSGEGATGATNNTGFNNIGLGRETLRFNTTGSRCMAIGDLCLRNNTTGNNNLGLGAQAVRSNTEGQENIGIGANALFTNTLGSRNIGIGSLALFNVTSDQNTAIGTSAGFNSTSATRNIFIGHQSGRYNETGDDNIIIGAFAGGFGAGAVNNFSRNTFIGSYSGNGLTTGNDNMFLGYKSGFNQTTNSNLLIIDNQDRGSAANEALQSLIYGTFNADPLLQEVKVNGEINCLEKSKMTNIGGFAIKLTNKTGGNSVAGQLVQADTTANDAVKLTGIDEEETIGVFLDSGVAANAEAWVVISGIADVAMQDNTTATRGNWVRSSITEAGYADATNSTPPSPAAFSHFNEIGNCIETVTATGGGTHVLARCVLHFN